MEGLTSTSNQEERVQANNHFLTHEMLFKCYLTFLMLGNTPFLDSTHLFRVLEMLFYLISYCLIERPVIMNDQNNIL